MSSPSFTERALVANVVAAPDDDAPRLVYADWLSERGDPRGELVVVQCSLARADRDDAPPYVTEPLRDREQALLAHHRDAWFDPLQDIAVGTYLFRRGFVERLDVLAPSIDGERLREAAPLLRALRTSHASSVPEYARSIAVEELTLYELTDVPAARRACEHEELGRLRRLDLHFRNADADLSRVRIAGERTLEHYGLHAPVLRVADPPVLLSEVLPRDRSALRSLRFSRMRLDDLRPLAALTALEELVMIGCQLPVDQLVRVALPALRSLAITDRALSASDIAALLDAFPDLRRLRLSRDAIDNAGAAALAAHGNAAALRRLDLAGNLIGAAGAHALEASAHLRLVALDLAGNHVDAKAGARIVHKLPRD